MVDPIRPVHAMLFGLAAVCWFRDWPRATAFLLVFDALLGLTASWRQAGGGRFKTQNQ